MKVFRRNISAYAIASSPPAKKILEQEKVSKKKRERILRAYPTTFGLHRAWNNAALSLRYWIFLFYKNWSLTARDLDLKGTMGIEGLQCCFYKKLTVFRTEQENYSYSILFYGIYECIFVSKEPTLKME